jgi:glycosyltransferase involved in cell wall biosynthesis
MKVLMISTDRKLFDPKSTVRARLIHYGTIVEELHILVFARADMHLADTKIAENVFLYSTHSSNRFFYITDAVWKVKHFNIAFDMVTAQDPFECGLAAWRIAKKAKVPFELQVHTDLGSRYFKKESGLNRTRLHIARFTLPRANSVRVVSERIAAYVRLRTKAPVTILPIFVDVTAIANTNPTFSLHERYPDFTFSILMASRLEPEKDIEIAINALKDVVAKYPKTGLIILGDGFRKGAIELEAKRLGLSKHVIFPGWESDPISYFKGASMFLLTSKYEGYGQVLVEAAAAGCPIVSTDVGIVGSVLKENEDLLTVPIHSPKVVAEKISVLINDNNLRRRLVVHARDSVLTNLPKNFDAYLAEMRTLWENLTNSSKKAE